MILNILFLYFLQCFQDFLQLSIMNIEGIQLTRHQGKDLNSLAQESNFKEGLNQSPNSQELLIFYSSGLWSEQQNFKYAIFLYRNRTKFLCKLRNKKVRLFEQMSAYIQTRSTIQCRTHHQKYETKFGGIQSIIQFYKKQLGAQNFKKIIRNPTLQRQYIQKMKDNKIEEQREDNKKLDKREAGTQTDPIYMLNIENPGYNYLLNPAMGNYQLIFLNNSILS